MFQFNCQAVLYFTTYFAFQVSYQLLIACCELLLIGQFCINFALLLFFQSMIPPRIEQQSASSPCDLFGPLLLSGAEPLRDHLHEFLIDAFRSDLTYFWLE